MKISCAQSLNKKSDLLILPGFEDKALGKSSPQQFKTIVESIKKDFKGKTNEHVLVTPCDKKLPKHILFVGMGKREKLNATTVRNVAAVGVKFAKHKKVGNVSLHGAELGKYIQALVEGLVLANYNPAKYQTGKNKKRQLEATVKTVEILGMKTDAKMLKKGHTIANAVNNARDLINAPHSHMNGADLTRAARSIAKENGTKITVLNKKKYTKAENERIFGSEQRECHRS